MVHRLTLIAAIFLVAGFAHAQRPDLEPIPEPPPPPEGMSDEFEPEVTITKRGEDTVEEYRVRGRVYMVKVTPPHGVPYYLVDAKGDGQLVRYEDVLPTLSVPMWVIRSW